MNKKNYDFLDNLSTDNIEELSRIIEKYPLAEKSEIINSCEEKLIMKKNNNNLYEVNEPVEVIRKVKWYRSPAFSIAASLAIVVGVAGVGFMGMGNNQPPENQPSVSTQISETRSVESSATTTAITTTTIEVPKTEVPKGSYVSPSSLTTTDATTEEPLVTTYIDEMQSGVAVASISTTVYEETVPLTEPIDIPEETAETTTGICSGVPLASGMISGSSATTTTVDWESVAVSVLSTATTDESGIPPQIHLPCIEAPYIEQTTDE